MSREYQFKLPQTISGFVASFIPSELEKAGIWDKIPDPLKIKINAAGWNSPLEITQEDFDSLDDDTWAVVQTLIQPYL